MPSTATARSPRLFTRVHILSDSTGNLPRHMMTAFSTQFPPDTFTISVKPFLNDGAHLEGALSEVKKSPGMVLHAFVSAKLKKAATDFCRKEKLPCCDLTGT